MREGLIAEFESASALIAASREMVARGYRRMDSYAPYPLPEAERALGMRRSRLPLAVFAVGISAAAGAFGLQWLLNGYLYPLDVGSRPPFMPLPAVIITFEMGVLFAGFTAFLGVLALARATRLWDPVFEVAGFERASIDRFFLAVDARDTLFDEGETGRRLTELGAVRVSRLGREGTR
jgi:hypothetical protein